MKKQKKLFEYFSKSLTLINNKYRSAKKKFAVKSILEVTANLHSTHFWSNNPGGIFTHYISHIKAI